MTVFLCFPSWDIVRLRSSRKYISYESYIVNYCINVTDIYVCITLRTVTCERDYICLQCVQFPVMIRYVCVCLLFRCYGLYCIDTADVDDLSSLLWYSFAVSVNLAPVLLFKSAVGIALLCWAFLIMPINDVHLMLTVRRRGTYKSKKPVRIRARSSYNERSHQPF